MMANNGDYVICVNNDFYNSELTLGKRYKVVESNHSGNEKYTDTYSIYDDTGLISNFYYWRFELDIRSIRKRKLKKIYEK